MSQNRRKKTKGPEAFPVRKEHGPRFTPEQEKEFEESIKEATDEVNEKLKKRGNRTEKNEE